MYERRWPVVVAGIVGIVIVAAIAWAAGRSSAGNAEVKEDNAPRSAITFVDGIPVGVQRSRSGALAAADNYVTLASETAVQDARRYEQLVRQVYAPSYQATALREAAKVRADAPELVAAYKRGRQGLAVVAARRLDVFSGDAATVMSWRAGVVWSTTDKPFSQWFLTKMKLRWDGERWLVESVEDATRPAPAPPIRYQDRASLEAGTFTRELRGMTAPIYGAAQ